MAEMEQMLPWSCLVALIEAHYPKAGGGRKPFQLVAPSGVGKSMRPGGSGYLPTRIRKRTDRPAGSRPTARLGPR